MARARVARHRPGGAGRLLINWPRCDLAITPFARTNAVIVLLAPGFNWRSIQACAVAGAARHRAARRRRACLASLRPRPRRLCLPRRLRVRVLGAIVYAGALASADDDQGRS